MLKRKSKEYPYHSEAFVKEEHKNLHVIARNKVRSLFHFNVSETHHKNLLTSSPTHLLTSKKNAFTLAEVLITLGIIGVVVAMTLPTLSAKIQKIVLKNQIKKNYSYLA